MSILAERYDALFIDLDGVVYRADQAVPAAAQTLDRVREGRARILFFTNNSSQTQGQVVGRLEALGVRARDDEILTSGLATASMIAREGANGRTAFVIGERGIREALEGVGVHLLDGEPERADLVVVGWDRSVDYSKLRTASLLVQRGARLVATNADASYPAPNGLWPGAGAILAAVVTATGASPTVMGKPARPLFESALEATGASRPLVVGDRLETDITGAAIMGLDSLLILTGVSRPADLTRTVDLPTYVGTDLSALLDDVPPGRFRPALEEDVHEIRQLLSGSGLGDDGVEDRVESTFVCGDVDGLAATACLQEVHGYGILRSVAVRSSLRGKGLGMLAVAWSLREARALGITHVSLFTEHASRFFQRLGFRPMSREDLPEPVRKSRHAAEECAASATPMALELGS